mmetsp:Transcript_69853/g.227287  ORF Transcript_69853/g.227287 Transcript_69853/m.227287 type:complete len:253 (+) Transcript_69853:119-877(+)
MNLTFWSPAVWNALAASLSGRIRTNLSTTASLHSQRHFILELELVRLAAAPKVAVALPRFAGGRCHGQGLAGHRVVPPAALQRPPRGLLGFGGGLRGGSLLGSPRRAPTSEIRHWRKYGGSSRETELPAHPPQLFSDISEAGPERLLKLQAGQRELRQRLADGQRPNGIPIQGLEDEVEHGRVQRHGAERPVAGSLLPNQQAQNHETKGASSNSFLVHLRAARWRLWAAVGLPALGGDGHGIRPRGLFRCCC